MKITKRTDLISSMNTKGYALIGDTGSVLVFRKKFNWLAFILWCLFTNFIGGTIYLIVHFNKQKIFEKYK